ncbi:MAG: ABC transporter substrate-binding protein [Sphaerochaetaceae bacterium]
MKKKFLIVALLLIVASISIFANGSTEKPAVAKTDSSEATSAMSYADEIIVGDLSEPKYLDPNAPGVGGSEINVCQQIYEGLVKTDKDGIILPCLASDWTISDDGMVYTFNLVPGVTFSDGTPVTGEDWEWSLLRARDYEASSYRFIAENIDTVEATDSQVVITLKQAAAPFIYDLANFNMVVGCKKHWEAVGDSNYLTDPIGTGPYMLESWDRGKSLVLTANPNFREEGYPLTKNIKYLMVADDNTRFMQLQSGQLDIIGDIPFSIVPMIKADKDLVLDMFDSTKIRYLILNTTKAPFDDPAVRKAMYYAIDKKELAQAITGVYGNPVSALVSPTQGKWSNNSLEVTPYQPEKAKEALKAAGYDKPIKFTLSVFSGSKVYEQMATLIQSQVNKAGFDCDIELLESAAIDDKYTSLSHQATILMWIDDIRDASEVCGWTVDYDQCDAWYTGLRDQALEDLNNAAFKELDEEKRVQMYQEIQQQVYDNANVIPMFSTGFAYASSSKIKGLYVSPFGVYESKNWQKVK